MKRIHFFLMLAVIFMVACNLPLDDLSSVSVPEMEGTTLNENLTELPRTDAPGSAPPGSESPIPPDSTATITPTGTDALSLRWIQFTSDQIGWGIELVEPEAIGEPRNARILRSEDGGATWRDVTPATIPSRVASLLYPFDSNSAILTISADIEAETDPVYRYVMKVYLTSDGGRSWTETATLPIKGLSPSQIDFIDRNNGWMWVQGGVAAGSEGYEIFGTTNGGNDWILLTESPLYAGGIHEAGDLPSVCGKTGIGFVDDHSGWVSGHCGALPQLFLYATNDRGFSWYPRQTLPLPESVSPDLYDEVYSLVHPPAFFADRNGTMLVTFSMQEGPLALLYTTSDGGVNWRVSILPTIPELGMDFVSPSTGWIADRETLLMTVDSGETWIAKAALPELQGFEPQLDFLDERYGWILDGELLYRTTDSGASWESISPSAIQ